MLIKDFDEEEFKLFSNLPEAFMDKLIWWIGTEIMLKEEKYIFKQRIDMIKADEKDGGYIIYYANINPQTNLLESRAKSFLSFYHIKRHIHTMWKRGY